MSAKILALETSTEACSVALFNDGIIIERYQMAPRQHSQLILSMLDALLIDAKLTLQDMDALAFGRGPGSFTGLRIASSVIQGISLAMNLPVIPISTLQCLAQNAYRELGYTRVLAAIDARMQQVFWAGYQLDENHIMVEVDREQLTAPQELISTRLTTFCGIGSGWECYHAQLTNQFDKKLQAYTLQRYPRAYDIAYLAAHAFANGQWVSANEALPHYLRETVC